MEINNLISNCIKISQDIIYFSRIQSYSKASGKFGELIKVINTSAIFAELLANHHEMIDIISQLYEALDKNDMILMADVLEDAFIPYLKSFVNSEEPIIIGNYSVENCSIGCYTIKSLKNDKYLHSNVNPYYEARCLIDSCVKEIRVKYAVLGLGLGYHIEALNAKNYGGAQIMIFERDKNMIELCEKYGCRFSGNNITIIHDPDSSKFTDFVNSNDCGIIMHYPSILLYEQTQISSALKHFYASINSWYNFRDEIDINYLNNEINCEGNVDDLQGKIEGKNVIIVAAGPSLDRSKEVLRKKMNSKEDTVIIAVSTVLKKMLSENISVDYAIVMDPQERTYGHIVGVENCSIPMIIDSAAFWKFSKEYKGYKYIAYQKGYKPAEEKATQNGRRLYETGGSVTTLALDIAIKLGAKSISFMGVDMAFPGGVSHADGTMDKRERKENNLICIKDVKGNDVYTDSLMQGYLNWIENRIKESPNIEYYNYSDSGAMIKGTKVISIS